MPTAGTPDYKDFAMADVRDGAMITGLQVIYGPTHAEITIYGRQQGADPDADIPELGTLRIERSDALMFANKIIPFMHQRVKYL